MPADITSAAKVVELFRLGLSSCFNLHNLIPQPDRTSKMFALFTTVAFINAILLSEASLTKKRVTQ